MSRSEIIRASTSADIPLLSALFAEVFGNAREPSVWRWKYFDNPRGCASFLCIAEGRVVAHCAGTPVRMADGAGRYLALQSVDFMSSAKYAGGMGGGGVFVRTVHAFFDTYCGASAVPLVYGFPGERHRKLGERLLGYRATDEVVEFTLAPSGSGATATPLKESDLAEFDHDWGGIAAVRDLTYLTWRYLNHPAFRYEKVESRRGASAIVRRTSEALYVMELGGRITASSVAALAGTLSRFGQEATFWGSRAHPVGALLESAGFHAKPRGHHLECRYFSEHPVPVAGELYFTLGDYDVH